MQSTRRTTRVSQSGFTHPASQESTFPNNSDRLAARLNIKQKSEDRQAASTIKNRETPSQRLSDERRCPECKSCTWVRVDADLPQRPFCDNAETKQFNHPIGWLHARSRACPLFEVRDEVVPMEALINSNETLVKTLADDEPLFKAHRWMLDGAVLLADCIGQNYWRFTTGPFPEIMPESPVHAKAEILESANLLKVPRMSKLPYGVKTLAEIDNAQDPVLQIILLGILLEHLLRKVSSDGNGSTLEELIREHENDFSARTHEVHTARWVRNQIMHGSGRITQSHIDKANTVLKSAVRDILWIVPTGDVTRMAAS